MESNFKDFVAFADEIQRIEKAKQDFVAPMSKIKMVAPNTITLEQKDRFEEFGVTENGHRQLAEKVGIPFDYYSRAEQVPGLREYNVNAWARSEALAGKKRLIRTLDGNVRAVLASKFKPLDNFMLLDALTPSLAEVAHRRALEMKTFALSENHLYLQVIFPETRRELVRPGEHVFLKEPIPIMAGLTIRNSETGHARLDVRRMVWNLVCWNGAIRESVLSMYHLGKELEGDGEDGNGSIWSEETLRKEVDLIRSRAKDIVAAAMEPSALDGFVEKASASIERRIERPMDELIMNVTKRWGFTKEEGQKIEENILEGGPGNRTAWGLANAINFLAHSSASVDRQYEVEKLSNDVIELSDKDWKVIAN